MAREFVEKMRFHLSIAILLGLCAGLSGCISGANVKSAITIPKPLIDPVPVTVGLYISQELKDEVYEEVIRDYGRFKIDLGKSQEHLFTQVFGAVFANVVVLESLDEIPEGVKGIIVPRIVKPEMATPYQTGDDAYEVRIRYGIELRATNGNVLHDWNVAAYGSANRQNYSNPLDRATKALKDATKFAMRDAAAKISFYFVREQPVVDWLGLERAP